MWVQSRLATISSNAVTRPNLHSGRGHAFCLCGSAELVAQIFSTEANPSNPSSSFLTSNCRRQEDALGEYVLVEGVREAGWPVWRQEQSGLLLFRWAHQLVSSELRLVPLRSNASSSWAVGRSLGSEAIHMENRGEGCPHVLTSAWRVAGAGRLHEDYTLRARFEDGILALSSKTLWHP